MNIKSLCIYALLIASISLLFVSCRKDDDKINIPKSKLRIDKQHLIMDHRWYGLWDINHNSTEGYADILTFQITSEGYYNPITYTQDDFIVDSLYCRDCITWEYVGINELRFVDEDKGDTNYIKIELLSDTLDFYLKNEGEYFLTGRYNRTRLTWLP